MNERNLNSVKRFNGNIRYHRGLQPLLNEPSAFLQRFPDLLSYKQQYVHLSYAKLFNCGFICRFRVHR